MGKLQRVESPSPAQFDALVSAGRPAILTGVASKWEGCEKWTPEYLRAAAGFETVSAHVYPDGDFHAVWEGTSFPLLRDVTLAAALDRMVEAPSDGSPERYYVLQSVPQRLSGLFAETTTPAFLLNRPGLRAVTFIGRNTDFPVHFHPFQQVVLAQLVGEKRVTLFAPNLRRGFLSRPLFDPFFHQSDMRHASFRGVAPDYEDTLRPGEMLFFPLHWWHFVESKGFSAALQFAWQASLRDWTFSRPGARAMVRRFVGNIGVPSAAKQSPPRS